MRNRGEDDEGRPRGAAGGGSEPGPATADDLAAYESLVRRYGTYVYNLAFRMSGSDADAKDLAQEAFIRVFRAFRRIDPEAPLEAWLHRIVKNLYIDLIRKYPKGRLESLWAPVPTAGGGEVTREWPGPEADNPETVVDAQMDDVVQRALLGLPKDLRMVVVLSDIQGLAYEEIAQMLAVPLGTVKSRLHRARKILQGRLGHLVKKGQEGA
ncbi:MAG TPA: sigma-70 family RNA polymerase sigma factor [bacterium]|nr:sigma-70 family RNA polymerase sigma factor [bacterium]